jgi:CelD/BcsL family acetyltransferase involved in cellulose biosynthesis
MSNMQVLASNGIPSIGPAGRATASVHRLTQDIAVESADAARFAEIRPAWIDLLARADTPNVFMDPALLRAAAELGIGAPYRAVLAWKQDGGVPQLIGAWAFVIRRPRRSPLPVRMLLAPSTPNGYLATPVIDRAHLDQALEAMLEAVVRDPQLPKIIALDAMGTDGPTMEALTRVLAARGTAPCVFEQRRRPKLASTLDGKAYLEQALSGSSRKKLRQSRRRLSEKGALTSVVLSEPAAIRRALDEFLTMEAAGWKGRNGTALLCDEIEAKLVRAGIAALAEDGCISIHALYLDGRPVSMQVVGRSGPAAFTWKTTYDETFHDVSPGMLLLEDCTAAFLADKSIAYVDSCSFDDTGFMATWTERQAVADLWIDARRGGSLQFRVLGTLQKSYRDLRATAKRAYLAWRSKRKR